MSKSVSFCRITALLLLFLRPATASIQPITIYDQAIERYSQALEWGLYGKLKREDMERTKNILQIMFNMFYHFFREPYREKVEKMGVFQQLAGIRQQATSLLSEPDARSGMQQLKENWGQLMCHPMWREKPLKSFWNYQLHFTFPYYRKLFRWQTMLFLLEEAPTYTFTSPVEILIAGYTRQPTLSRPLEKEVAQIIKAYYGFAYYKACLERKVSRQNTWFARPITNFFLSHRTYKELEKAYYEVEKTIAGKHCHPKQSVGLNSLPVYAAKKCFESTFGYPMDIFPAITQKTETISYAYLCKKIEFFLGALAKNPEEGWPIGLQCKKDCFMSWLHIKITHHILYDSMLGVLALNTVQTLTQKQKISSQEEKLAKKYNWPIIYI